MRSRGWDPRKVVRSKTTFDAPLRRTRKGEWKIPDGSFVFVCPLGDFFHDEAELWRWEALGIMAERPGLTFLIPTKRADAMNEWAEMIGREWADSDTSRQEGWIDKWKHIWIGVTAENQEMADERIPQLLSIDWPGKKWVSVEPMLGPVDMERPWGHGVGDLMVDSALRTSHLDWVICGGESGPGARSFDVEWGRSLRDQCQAAGVPFWMKQLGGWPNRREKLEEIQPDLRIRERPGR
jgi:protein gp37